MLGLDRDAAEREAREDFALIGLRGKRPGPLLILGGDPDAVISARTAATP